MPSKDFLKATNRSTILNVIKAYGEIARTDIARLTGLSPAGVTGITAQLIQDGLVLEKQEGSSRGGRRPILLALNPRGAYVVGMKLALRYATFALTDLNADVLARHDTSINTDDAHNAAAEVAVHIQTLVEAAQIDSARLLGVGVGVPGVTNWQRGLLRASPFTGWRDAPFAELLEAQLGYPVLIDNDVNTLTLYERLFGYGRSVSDFLVVTIGRGVGLGIVANGQLYRGAHGGAGEFGHITIDPEGPVCACGSRGCLETFVADPWMVRRAVLNGLHIDQPEALTTMAQAGSAVALDVLAQAGAVLGRSLAMLVNLFNPQLIVLSGEGIRARAFIAAPLLDAMRRHAFGPLAGDVEVRFEALDDDAWARGAASLVLGQIFHLPEVSNTMHPAGSLDGKGDAVQSTASFDPKSTKVSSNSTASQ